MKKKHLIISTLCLLLSGGIGAQVTIGSAAKPVTGALLDLKEKNNKVGEEGRENASKGFCMPRVELKSLDKLTMGTNVIPDASIAGGGTVWEAHAGLIVYNINTVTGSAATLVCPGLHVWDGDKWRSIVPYPAIPAKTIISKNIITEASRTPIIDPVKYPIGSLNQFTDTRGLNGVETNKYHHARFYAHKVQATGDITYRGIRNPYICDASLATIEDWTETGTIEYIDDGVWMTENLNTEYLTAASPTKMQKSAVNNDITPQYYSPTNTGTDAAQAVQNGFLYNWAAATNQKGGTVNGQENVDNPGVLNEPHSLHKERQGICPTGWHLPSDKEYNELEATYAPSSSNFTLSPTMAFDWSTSYHTGEIWRPNTEKDFGHGKSMKSTTPLNGILTYGDSKTANNGGFNLLLAGAAYGGTTNLFATIGNLWSSSSYAGLNAWGRGVHCNRAGVLRGTYGRNYLLSVRCKKNDY